MSEFYGSGATSDPALAALRRQPVGLDTTYDQIVREAVTGLEPGIRGITDAGKELSRAHNLPLKDVSSVCTSLLASPRVIELTKGNCYVVPESHIGEVDAPHFRALQFIDHLYENPIGEGVQKMTTYFRFADNEGFAPTDTKAIQEFRYIFKMHPRVVLANQVVQKICSPQEAAPPAQLGGLMDKSLSSIATVKIQTDSQLLDKALPFRTVNDETLHAFREALYYDSRFGLIGYTALGGAVCLIEKPDAQDSMDARGLVYAANAVVDSIQANHSDAVTLPTVELVNMAKKRNLLPSSISQNRAQDFRAVVFAHPDVVQPVDPHGNHPFQVYPRGHGRPENAS